MNSRYDSVGIFWEEEEAPKSTGKWTAPSVMPPVPHTGWTAPKEFPRLDAANIICIDVETYDPELREKGPGVRRDGYIAGLAIGLDDGHRWYFPMRHSMGGNLNPENVMAFAKHELAREHQPKLGTNLTYDLDYLAEEGVEVKGPIYDIQIAEPLIDENALSYSLQTLSRKYLGESKVTDQLYDWSARAYGGPATTRGQAPNIWRCPVELVGPYAEGDVDLPLRIFNEQRKQLEKEELWNVFSIESSIVPLILAMRRRGVRVDLEAARRLDDELTQADALASRNLKGVEPHAAESIARYCKANNIPFTHTATGRPSFTSEYLAAATDPVLRAVYDTRRLRKLRDTFVRGYVLNSHINERIHCTFHQLRSDESGAVSGRFSSSDPNLQNIPTRDKVYGPKMRALFLPEEGEQWVRYDWSQIEFRCLAHYGRGRGADTVRARYNTDPTTDFHSVVSEMTGVERGPAKNINFGLVYGMGVDLLAEQLGRTKADALVIFEQYHQLLPFVRETLQAVSNVASTRGYIKTIEGRRRRFDVFGLRKGAKWEEGMPKYGPIEVWQAAGVPTHKLQRLFTHKALNAVLQGSAADMMKKAMRRFWLEHATASCGVPLMTVHDELDFSFPFGEQADKEMLAIKHLLENTTKLRIPVIADMQAGVNWSACK